MKKSIYISIFTIIFFILLYLLYPRTVENGIYIKTVKGQYEILYNGKSIHIKNTTASLEKYQVINCTYNLFKTFNLQIQIPNKERIMVKEQNSYELEQTGTVALDTSSYFYKIDANNEISFCTSKDVIVGKDNIETYFNKNGFIQIFLIYPINYSKIRVAISNNSFNSIYHEKLSINCLEDTKLINYLENKALELAKNSLITITYNNESMIITTDKETYEFDKRTYLIGNKFTINEITRGWPKFNAYYNDTLELYPTPQGIILINELATEEYLKRVVPSEMPTTGGLESLKCQAVAARTYAISDMLNNRYAYLGFHVDDSTKSQVYNNTPLKDLTTQAVNETEGQVLLFNGKPIDAKYYSTSSGYGADFNNIWFRLDSSPTNVPYLTTNNFMESKILKPMAEEDWLDFYKNIELSSYDSLSPYFRWKITYSKNDLVKVLKKSLIYNYENSRDYMKIFINGKENENFPEELSELTDIIVLERSEAGNVIEISFIFKEATIDIRKDNNVRRCFNNGTDIISSTINIERRDYPALELWSTLPSSFFSVEKEENDFIVYGGGFGHGVGMSQYGAMYLSQNGYNYNHILSIYYKNTELKKLY
jgi:SpoIID/LytB domain protein